MSVYEVGLAVDTTPSRRVGSVDPRPMPDLDPRWEWHEVTALGDRERRYVKGRCNHLETVPVESLDGEEIARLCTTCDTHFYRGSAA